MVYGNSVYLFTKGGVCLTGKIDGHILLQGHDTEFQLLTILRKSP